MKSSYINTIIIAICFVANLTTVFVDAKKNTGNLRRKIISGSSKGSSFNSSSSKGKGRSSKSPSSKGKVGKSSKSPSSKGKVGKSSKSPSSKGKGGKSSKSPKSSRSGKGKGRGSSSRAPSASAPSAPGPNSPTTPEVPTEQLFCAGYTEEEYNSILSIATVSNVPGQPVNVQAANFVQQERFCPPGASILTLETLLHERYALSAFYFASGGATWRFCRQGQPCAEFENQMADSWLSNSHVCKWYGISCDGNNKVVDIAMVPSGGIDIGLNGIIANEVYELTELVTLKLEFNDLDPNKRGKLKGTLSDAIGNAKNLKLFDIDQQQVGGVIPDSFYDARSLSNVDLDNNQFTGTLSGPGIAKLQDLVFFSASGNPFAQQPLPWQFGTLKSLRFLGLSEANLVGTVPPYFQQLTEMRALDLHDNGLSGSISFLSNYKSLETINLSNNDFTGAIPSSLWTRSTLKFVILDDTLLGAAGDDFPDLGINWNMPELQVLRLANTDLSGPLPVEGLKKLTSLRVLTLENTNLVGTIPVESCSNWDISISKNGGIICPAKCSCIESQTDAGTAAGAASVAQKAFDYRYFAAGGICAATSHGITTPIDVVKTKMQAQPQIYNKGMTSAAVSILKSDGPGALLGGLGPTVVGYGVEGAMKFGCYEIAKPIMSKIFSSIAVAYILASILAGAVASILLCPMESARIRVVTDKDYKGLGLLQTLPRLIKEDGFWSLFGGIFAMLSKQVPYTMGKQVSFDIVAKALYKFFESNSSLIKNASDVKWIVSILAAFVASIFACIFSQPGDMILTDTYKSKSGQSFFGVIDDIYQKGGIGGFFTGTGARIVHVSSIITSQLVIYDIVKQALGLPATGSH